MSTDPGPPAKPPRSALSVRDLLGALVVLGLIILAAGGLTGSCSFAPTGPTIDSSRLPVVDAPAELARLATDTPFPVRVPAVPPGWRANAVDRAALPDGTRAVRTGYLTPDGRYLRLQQSDAGEEALLLAEAGEGAGAAQGVVDVDGQRWVAYTGQRDEQIWITEVAGDPAVRLLVTGSGSEADFRALAAAAVTAEALPR